MRRPCSRSKKQAHNPKPKPKAAPAKGGGGKGGGKGKVPQEVFNHVKANANGKCTFFNLGKCKVGDECRDAHACCDCGGPRSYVSAHVPRQ